MTKAGRVKQELLQQIKAGNFPRGTQLPSEVGLMNLFHVSHMTIRKAIGELERENYITRIPRIGMFINESVSEDQLQKQIGVILPAYSAMEHFDLMHGATSAAEKEHLLSRVFLVRSSEDRLIQDAMKCCDALLCFYTGALTPSLAETFREWGKPVVFADQKGSRYGFDCVSGDAGKEMKTVLNYLNRHGHTKIAYLDQLPPGRISPSGFYDAWKEYTERRFSLEEAERWKMFAAVPSFERPHRKFYELVTELVKKGPLECSAMVFPSAFSYGILAALYDAGVRIPEDLSIMTIGTRSGFEFIRPRLAHLHISREELAGQAVELVVRRFANPERPPQFIGLPPLVVEGDSVKNKL